MSYSESRNPHSPCHQFVPDGCYIVTAATYLKKQYLRSAKAKDIVLAHLFEKSERYGWQLQAWAVLSNHYHFVALAPEDAQSLTPMLQQLHSESAEELNLLQSARGRQVWYQFWDTCITSERSHLARHNYVHRDPQHHRVTRDAARYRWCSMGWLLEFGEETARPILSAPIDSVNVYDDFD